MSDEYTARGKVYGKVGTVDVCFADDGTFTVRT